MRRPGLAVTLALTALVAAAVAEAALHLSGADHARYDAALIVAALLVLPVLATASWQQHRAHREATASIDLLAGRLEAVQRGTNELVWEIDAAGTLTYLNYGTYDVIGVRPDVLLGTTVFDLVHPDDAERARGIFRRSTEQLVGWDRVRLRVRHTDGEPRWVETSSVAQVGARGELSGFTATSHLIDPAVPDASVGARARRIDELLDGGPLDVVLQPIFSLVTGRAVGAEALSRFPSDPAQSVEAWFTDAHDVGRGVDLELLAIRTALAAAAGLDEELYVSVNVSPVTLESADLVAVITDGPIRPERVVVELTEHLSVDDYDGLLAGIERLRACGVRLAIDDAGAGYASFRHILRLGPDMIKIDRAIVRGIDADPAHRALAAALVMFALEVGGTTVVAEGIETAAELDAVAVLGMDAGQGYFLGRPAADVVGWEPADLRPAARARAATRLLA